jgi:hypothetical protein
MNLRFVRDLVRPFISLTTEYKVRRVLYKFIPVRNRSRGHVVHACLWKTGSQWVRLILSDPRVYRYDGRLPYVWSETEGQVLGADSQDRGRLLLSCFAGRDWVNKYFHAGKDSVRAIFVVRSPRQLILSWYFSTRFTHEVNEEIAIHRKNMEGLSDAEGLKYAVRVFRDEFLPIIESWLKDAESDEAVKIVQFESLVRADYAEWLGMLQHLGMPVGRDVLEQVLSTYHISKIKGAGSFGGGRYSNEKYDSAGKRDVNDYFTPDVRGYFEGLMPGLSSRLGYDD